MNWQTTLSAWLLCLLFGGVITDLEHQGGKDKSSSRTNSKQNGTNGKFLVGECGCKKCQSRNWIVILLLSGKIHEFFLLKWQLNYFRILWLRLLLQSSAWAEYLLCSAWRGATRRFLLGWRFCLFVAKAIKVVPLSLSVLMVYNLLKEKVVGDYKGGFNCTRLRQPL